MFPKQLIRLAAAALLLRTALSVFVLVPLYAYPTSEPFKKYLSSFTANPDVNFKVIINPDSGPGSSTYPDSNYIAAISLIRTYSNVQILGYVHTSTATRPIANVITEVHVYANWRTYTAANISVDGIFFDEAPSRWTIDTSIYMTSAVATATREFGLTPYIVFNPGTSVDVRFYSLANNILVWENSYSAYSSASVAAVPSQYASQSTMMIHDFTGTTTDQTVRAMLNHGIGGMFISDQSSYADISSIWSQYCKSING